MPPSRRVLRSLRSSALVVRAAGFAWPTERIGRTTRVGRRDHLFARGRRLPDDSVAGVLPRARGISDHHPVWLRVVLP